MKKARSLVVEGEAGMSTNVVSGKTTVRPMITFGLRSSADSMCSFIELESVGNNRIRVY